MNDFFGVLGLPRSCTTYLCRTLDDNLNIFIPKMNQYEPINWNNLEPSSLLFKNIFEPIEVLKKIKIQGDKEGAKFTGVKLLPHNLQYDLVRNSKISTIVILRKNIWKVIGSTLIAARDNNWSSTSKIADPVYYNMNNPFNKALLKKFFNELVNWIYYCEKKVALSDKHVCTLYFEDFIINNKVDAINNYFSYEYFFNASYDDSHHAGEYILNIEELGKFIEHFVNSAKEHFSNLPDWALESILKDYK